MATEYQRELLMHPDYIAYLDRWHPRLSFFVRNLGVYRDHTWLRTRHRFVLGEDIDIDGVVGEVVGLGWEGDRFIVHVDPLF